MKHQVKNPLAFIVLIYGGGLVSCDGDGPDVNKDQWTAITDQQWPPGEIPEDAELDVNRQRTNLAVVLDMSGSMGSKDCAGDYASKAKAARAALGTWAAAVPSDANLGLIAFVDNKVRTLEPLGNGNRDRFAAATDELVPHGGTPLRSGMQAAHEMLIERARYQLGYGRYQIVVITDGEHSSGENPLPLIEGILANPANPIEIHTIGFCIEDSALKKPGMVHYQSAHDPDQLAQGLSRVLAESNSFQPVEDFNE